MLRLYIPFVKSDSWLNFPRPKIPSGRALKGFNSCIYIRLRGEEQRREEEERERVRDEEGIGKGQEERRQA